MPQAEFAQTFGSLHTPGKPLVLYNIWDAGGAKALAKAGAAAVATGSWSVAAAHGYPDGEAIPLDLLLRVVERIVATVDIPVSVDMEGGFAVALEEVAENIRQVLATGAVGINFEDQVVGGAGLHKTAVQAARIAAIRAVAEAEGVDLFINARTDLFLKEREASAHGALVSDALARAAAYADAGASGFFVPGLTDGDLIREIVGGTSLPVNVMMRGDLAAVAGVAELGVARASFGPAPYAQAIQDLSARYAEAVG